MFQVIEWAAGARLLAGGVACALAIAAGPVGCGSEADRAEKHIVRAREFLAEANRAAARIELENAIQSNPDSGEANLLLGKIAVSEGRLDEAVFYLREAQRAEPENSHTALELASLLYGTDTATALQLVNEVIEREPDNPEAQQVLALVSVAAGDTPTAVQAANRSLELSPESPESHWTLGWVHQAVIRERALLREPPEDRHFEIAIQAFEDYITLGGEHPWKALLEQARSYSAWPGHGADAAEAAGQAMAVARDSGNAATMLQAAELMSKLARALGSSQLHELAVDFFLELDPSDLYAWKSLADLREASGESADAVYRKMLDALPEDADAHTLYARHILHTRGFYAAIAYFEEKAGEGVNPPRMLSAMINLYYAARQSDSAARTLARLKREYPDHPWTDLERAQELIRKDETREAAHILSALVAEDPLPEALALLASTELTLGNRTAAHRAARAALSNATHFDPANVGEMSRVLYAVGKYRHAAQQLSILQKRVGLDDTQKIILARCQYEIGETHKARLSLLEMTFRAFPSEGAIRSLSEYERRTPRREAWLREILEKAHQRNRSDITTLQLLTSMDLEGKRGEKALARLDRSLRRHPRSVEHLLMRVRVADHLGHGETALGDARRAYMFEPGRAGLADLIVSLHTRYGATDESIAELESALSAPDAWATEKAARSAQDCLLLTRLHLLDGEGEKAIAALERANGASPRNPAIQTRLAYLLASSGLNLGRSLTLARRAYQAAPRDPATADTLGFVYLRLGRNELALDFVRRALALASPPEPLYHYHESVALQALGRDREALAAIKAVLTLSPDYPGAAAMRAKLEAGSSSAAPSAS